MTDIALTLLSIALGFSIGGNLALWQLLKISVAQTKEVQKIADDAMEQTQKVLKTMRSPFPPVFPN